MARHGDILKRKGHFPVVFTWNKTMSRNPPRKLSLISHWSETRHRRFSNGSPTSWMALLFNRSGPCVELGEKSVFPDARSCMKEGRISKRNWGSVRKKENTGWPLHQNDLSFPIPCIYSHWFPCLECPLSNSSGSYFNILSIFYSLTQAISSVFSFGIKMAVHFLLNAFSIVCYILWLLVSVCVCFRHD